MIIRRKVTNGNFREQTCFCFLTDNTELLERMKKKISFFSLHEFQTATSSLQRQPFHWSAGPGTLCDQLAPHTHTRNLKVFERQLDQICVPTNLRNFKRTCPKVQYQMNHRTIQRIIMTRYKKQSVQTGIPVSKNDVFHGTRITIQLLEY